LTSTTGSSVDFHLSFGISVPVILGGQNNENGEILNSC
jgi:hypothetical protein